MQWTLYEMLFAGCLAVAALFIPFLKTRWGENVVAACGGLMLLLVFIHGVDGYARGHWHFNSRLVPVGILGPDGRYLDGTPASDIERVWSQSGDGRDLVAWCLYAVLAAGIAYVWRSVTSVDQQRRRSRVNREPSAH